MKYQLTKQQLETAAKNSLSIAGICRELNIRPTGGNYKTIHYYLNLYNIDTSHFTGQGWNTGNRRKSTAKAISIYDILSGKVEYRSSYKLKNRILKEHIKEYRCENCGNTEWQGQKIPLELHHINGNNMDNRLENLQLLCPNCHALTDNYRGSNTHSSILSEKRNKEYSEQKQTLINNDIINKVNNKNICKKHNLKEKRYCQFCGKELNKKTAKYCSQECFHKAYGSKRPSLTELLNKFKELKSYLQVGKYYGVSDNAVRKWVNFYQLKNLINEQTKRKT